MPSATKAKEDLTRFAKWIPFLTLLVAAGALGFLLALPAVAGPAAQEPEAFQVQARGSLTMNHKLQVVPPIQSPLKVNDWTVLVDENFDGTWPNGLWDTWDDNGAAGGEYYWANRCANGSNRLNWAIGGGANGSALICDSQYPSNANSVAMYGPIDLTNATAGLLNYWY